MTIRTLYKYKRPDGGVTVSVNKPDGVYNVMYRIIADNGKLVTRNGNDGYSVIDTDYDYGWYEIDNTFVGDESV